VIALLLATSVSSALLLGGIVVALGLAVLIAHWASYRPPSTKQLIGAAVLASLLALVFTANVSATDDDDFLMQNPCVKYTSADWQWWAAGCMWPVIRSRLFGISPRDGKKR